MKNIFNASNSVEAYMVCNLLEQQGLEVRVENQHLQEGMKEYSASDFVRVLVVDKDYALASTIIKEWESQSLFENTQHKNKTSLGGLGFVLGTIFGAILVFLWLNSPMTEEGIDFNNDGIYETKYIYYADKLKRTEVDRNLDDKPDLIYSYDFHGVLSKLQADDNFDGEYETQYQFRRGVLASRKSDFKGDGKADYDVKYRYGVITEAKIYDPESKQLRKVQKFIHGKLFAAEFDTNGDGVRDKKEEYDFFEEIKNKRADQKNAEI